MNIPQEEKDPVGRCSKREAVLEAMLEMVAEHGFHGAPMSLVAERAKVGAGTIYRHFEDKDALIVACYHDIEERFYAAAMEGYPEERPVRERFLHLATAVVRYFVSNPKEFHFIQQFQDSPYGADIRREKMFGEGEKDLVQALFRKARAEQIMKDLPLPVLLSLAFGPLTHLCRDHSLGFLEIDDNLTAATVEACWDALKR